MFLRMIREVINVSSIHFQRIFKADTFLDVKLIPTYGRTKVQEKFDYFLDFPCAFATTNRIQAAL